MSNRIKNEISALLKYYQASPFSSKTLISNSGDCKDLISLICNGKRGKDATLSDVNKTKQLLVSAEKIHHQSCTIKLQRMCARQSMEMTLSRQQDIITCQMYSLLLTI